MIINSPRQHFKGSSLNSQKSKSISPIFNLYVLQSYRFTSFVLLLFTFALSHFNSSIGQVKIKEKVEIKPKKSIKLIKSVNSTSSISEDITYMRYGGSLYITPEPYPFQLDPGQTLNEQSLGQIADAWTPHGEPIYLGDFSQWHKFQFYIAGVSQDSTVKIYTNDGGIWDSYLGFYKYGIDSGFPIRWRFKMNTVIDSSKASIAPQEILEVFGNPFEESDVIEVPGSGEIFVKVIKAKSNSNDALYLDVPTNRLVKENLRNYVGEKLNAGRVETGEQLRFYLRTNNSPVSGKNLYPRNFTVPKDNDGEHIFIGTYIFENWTDLDFNDVKVEVYLLPDAPNLQEEILVEMNPEEIAPSGEADIFLQQINDYGPVEFSPGQLFDVEIIEGAEYGTLLSTNGIDTADTFTQIEQGVKFVSADEIELDSVEVLIKVTTEIEYGAISASIENMDNGSKKVEIENLSQSAINLRKVYTSNNSSNTQINGGKDKVNTLVIIVPPGGTREIYGIGSVTIRKDDAIEIMIGETKYFQARYLVPTTNELVIEVVEVGTDSVPALDGGLAQDVWGDNPIEIINDSETSGKKSGVYWETEKPVWDGTTNRGNLSEGLIRVVGRYWHQDSSYVVNLKAGRNEDSAEVKIQTIIPSRLVSEGQTNSYSKTRDIDDNVIDIDSLCILYGGLNGIPPQFIKGQIFQESAKTDFGGDIGMGFAPSYRYEPYTVQTWQGVLENMRNNPFYITSTTAINPPTHQHVRILPYFSGDTITVWQIVKEHSQLVEDGSTPETRLYGVRTHEDTMNYNAYPTIRNQYREIYDKTIHHLKIDPEDNERHLTFAERADSTNKLMIIYLRDEFTDEIGTVGMKNMIAQTRIASSYGYLQALYTTAIDRRENWDYPEDSNHPPEAINEFDVIFPMATRMQNDYLIGNLHDSHEPNNNWSIGFESALKEYILEEWNELIYYPSSVMNHTNKFLPQN